MAYDFTFSKLKSATNYKFRSKLFALGNEEENAEYEDLMTAVLKQEKADKSDPNKGKKLYEITKHQYLMNEKTGSFLVHVEWLTYELKSESPYKGVI